MRADGLQGVYRRRRRGCTVRDPDAAPSADLVQRRFTADRLDAMWVCDITQHRTDQGWLDAVTASRRVEARTAALTPITGASRLYARSALTEPLQRRKAVRRHEEAWSWS